MNTLERSQEAYRELSGTASTVSRHLAFAGIALIWIFKVNCGSQQKVPAELVLPAIFIVLALACDLLQYVVSAAIWGFYGRVIELRVADGKQMPSAAPPWFNWPAIGLFWAKVILVVLAYVLIFVGLADQIV